MEKQLQLKEQSSVLMVTVSDPEKFTKFEKWLNVKAIIETAYPISELRRVLPQGDVEVAIDTALTKLVGNLNLKWNLNDLQIGQIVEDLTDRYPHETVEDFILIFRKARQNEFGEIYRLDSAVIFGWMDKYLEEKYKIADKELERYKTINPLTEIAESLSPDRLKEWQAAIDSVKLKPILPLTEKEVLTEGQERVIKKQYPKTNESELLKRDRHFQWITENFDARTGEKLPTWISEEDFNANQ